jgi:outer membrane protein insertion porin family
VRGNRAVEADTIRSYFHPGARGELDAAAIDAGLKALYATGLFQDIGIRRVQGKLLITVVEAPVIDRVAFEGNKHIKDEQLTAEVQSKPRKPFSKAGVQADVQRILDVYHRGGRYDVRVDPKIIEHPNGRVDLIFAISEGKRTVVRRIEFIGNRTFGAYRLKQVIKTGASGLMSFLNGSDIYDPDRVEADRDLLRRFYLSKGYADVHVASATAEYDPALTGFVLTFTIEEGDVYRFGTVDVQSNVREVPSNALRPLLKVAEGSVYDAGAIEKASDRLSIELAKRGYAFAQVRPRGDREPMKRRIGVTFVVDEGPRAYIERINIGGNIRTREYVIRREFDISEGDAYNKVLLDRAERRLKNLGYFKSVKITNEPGSAPDRVVLNVQVEEQLTGDFNVSGGYSTAQGWLAEVSIGERNLLGTGAAGKLAVNFGQYSRGFSLSYTEPYFLGFPAAAGVDLFAQQNLESPYQSYGTSTYGGTLRAGLPLDENLGLQLHYSLFRQQLTLNPNLMSCDLNVPTGGPGNFPGCEAGGQASALIKEAALAGPQWVSQAGYSLTYSTLDNNRNPTGGVFSQLKQDVAGLGGDADFIKTASDTRYYYNVFGDVVAMGHFQAGDVTGFGGKSVPFFQEYFGGPWLVRGFAPNGFGPRDLSAGTSNDNVGGGMFAGGSVELQAPVPYLPRDVGLKVAVFVDAGNVWGYPGPKTFAPPIFPNSLCGQNNNPANCTGPADSKRLRSSAGAGLIWDSPFGPLRVDYARPLTKQGYDVVQSFRFGGGPAL